METLATPLGAMLVLSSAVWLLSYWLEDVSIVDVLWGPLVLSAPVCYLWLVSDEALDWYAVVLIGALAMWALRLSAHIAIRSRGHGEDARYKRMRDKRPQTFAFTSLVTVFGLQAVIAWLLSIPVLIALSSPAVDFGVWHTIGLTLWLIGFSIEAVADWQLLHFKSDPANRGRLMTGGLWAWSSHPNYFGEALLWWGVFCFCVPQDGVLYALFSPLMMTILLRYVSGVRLLEQALSKQKPGFAEYVATVPAFFPRFPRFSWPSR